MRVVFASLLAFLVLAAPARALDVYEEADSNGDPIVYASATKDPINWQACVAADCRAYDGDTWHAGETPAGTVFTATAGAASASTPAWGGRITATAAPALVGDFAVGGTVRPVAGRWSGGWGTELDDLRVEACYDETTCRTLSAPDWIKGGDGSVVLDAGVAGWRLRAGDRRRNRFEIRPAVVYTDPGEISPLTPGPLAAYSPLSAVVPVPPRPTVSAPDFVPHVSAPDLKLPDTPIVSFRKRAQRAKTGIVLGSVGCIQRCTVNLTVSDGKHTFTRTLSGRHVFPLALSRSAHPRAGTLKVKVVIDKRPAITGRVRF